MYARGPRTDSDVRGSDGKERLLGEDQFINRLVQFAIDKLGKSTHVKLVEETIQGDPAQQP